MDPVKWHQWINLYSARAPPHPVAEQPVVMQGPCVTRACTPMRITQKFTRTQKCLCVIMRLETQTSRGSSQTTLSHTSFISCSLTSLHHDFLSSLRARIKLLSSHIIDASPIFCHFMRQCLCAVHWCGKSSPSSSCLHSFRTLIRTSDEQQ